MLSESENRDRPEVEDLHRARRALRSIHVEYMNKRLDLSQVMLFEINAALTESEVQGLQDNTGEYAPKYLMEHDDVS